MRKLDDEHEVERAFHPDPGPNDEMNMIHDMLEDAEKSGLNVEVVWQFAIDLKRGASIGEAIGHARREWDI